MLGLDAVDIARVKKLVNSASGRRFLQKVFTPNELAYCTNNGKYKYESLAARFAAKESVGKALGVGIALGENLTSIEVVNDDKGKPAVVLHDKALVLAKEKNISAFELSLSHTDKTAYAVCLAK